jgi:hypothetical protein
MARLWGGSARGMEGFGGARRKRRFRGAFAPARGSDFDWAAANRHDKVPIFWLPVPTCPHATKSLGRNRRRHGFVLGDNRNRSKDSRSFGCIPLADIIGRVEYIYFPRLTTLNDRSDE